MNDDLRDDLPAPTRFIPEPRDLIRAASPKAGDRKVLGDRVVEFDGKHWREPASGRVIA